MNGLDRVRRARSQLLIGGHPFYGSLALELNMSATTEFDTMATDGKRLLVNLAFADSLTDAELRGVIVHEVMHCAYGHHVRQGNRDGKLWNEACDYAINRDILRDGFELPKERLYDARFDGMSAEAIYVTLKREQDQGGGKPGAGASRDRGRCGQVIPAAQPNKGAKLEEVKAEWQAKVFNAAAVAARQAGKVPAGLARVVDEQREPPKENWREVLRRFADQARNVDYSWSKPNRRFIAGGTYLPGVKPDPTAILLAGIDTSGSIDNRCLAEFASELQEIMDCGIVETVSVIYCDTELANEHDFEKGDTIKLNAKGGGGTDFAPVMAWGSEKQASCLIYFTDLECTRFGDDPGVPVLWATWRKPRNLPPFGEIIEIDPYDR